MVLDLLVSWYVVFTEGDNFFFFLNQICSLDYQNLCWVYFQDFRHMVYRLPFPMIKVGHNLAACTLEQ